MQVGKDSSRENVKIAVAGLGFVGLSNAVMFSKKYEVCGIDLDEARVDAVNERRLYLADEFLEQAFSSQQLNLRAATKPSEVYSGSDYLLVATPTNYDPVKNEFDTASIYSVLRQAELYCPDAVVIIKSTVPIGFTDEIKQKFKNLEVVFSPEFLREGSALFDSLNPSRIVIGNKGRIGRSVAALFQSVTSLDNEADVIFTGCREAEAIKLFSNSFLAMRVAYFNELDTFALVNGMDTGDIIKGVSSDPRVGFGYNNPSFGYGGYCLPKDTKQLRANYQNTPQALFSAIIESNDKRKLVLAKSIFEKKPKIVGIYRLSMKSGSDNYRESAILDIIEILSDMDLEMRIFEPNITDKYFERVPVMDDFDDFASISDLIVANRYDEPLAQHRHKVFSRDIFGGDS